MTYSLLARRGEAGGGVWVLAAVLPAAAGDPLEEVAVLTRQIGVAVGVVVVVVFVGVVMVEEEVALLDLSPAGLHALLWRAVVNAVQSLALGIPYVHSLVQAPCK